MRPSSLCVALLAAAAVAGAAGCVDDGPELRLTHLRVTGEWDGWGLLDVEVHMFDAVTRQHLGCSGQVEGLEDVDESDVSYHLDAYFRAVDEDVVLEPSILDGRMVELQVSEDDDLPCPDPPSADDEMIGISGPVSRAMADAGPMLTFGRVMELRLVID